MGLPGEIHVKITTVFDEKENSVTRTVKYLGGWGLNFLFSCRLGESKFWNINRHIVEDTIDLPDGTYTLDRKHVGPGDFDYKWSPKQDDND